MVVKTDVPLENGVRTQWSEFNSDEQRIWCNNYPYTCWIMLKENLDITVDCSWAWGNNMLNKENAHFVKSSTGCKHSKKYSFYIHVGCNFRCQVQKKKKRGQLEYLERHKKIEKNQKYIIHEKCSKDLGLSFSLQSLRQSSKWWKIAVKCKTIIGFLNSSCVGAELINL